MTAHESIADRRIREARERGLFDDLAGAGEPIADLHVMRPPGWWANRLLKQERSKLKLAALEDELRRRRTRFWRASDEATLRHQIAECNDLIADYNVVTALDPYPRLDTDDVVRRWRRQDSES